MKLGDFLQRTSFNIQCFLCKFLIIDKEFIYSKNNKMFYHINCLKNSRNIKNNEYIKVDSNYLFNYCLNHNNKFVFYCKECKLSLCSLCDINFHNDKDHLLQQIISLRKNKNKEDNFKIIINKQRDLLNKIKEIYNKLFQSLENDIIIKEKILDNYKKNYYNYESIQNFNNLELKNNKKYEILLEDIIKKNDEFEEKGSSNKNYDEIFINAILSPFYYSMMISDNPNYKANEINLLFQRIMNINIDLNLDQSKNIISNNFDSFEKNDNPDNNNNLS